MADPSITEQARALLDAATPGPWTVTTDRNVVAGGEHYSAPVCNVWDRHDGNGALIAAAPTIIAGLLAELDARTDPDLAARLTERYCAFGGPDDPCGNCDPCVAAQMIGGEQ